MRGGAFSERSFRLLFAGQGISSIGDRVVPIALSFAVLDLTGSVRDLGLVLAAQALPLVLFVLIGGVWSDRLPRQRVMLVSNLIRAAVQLASAVLLLAGTAQIWELAALQGVYGLARAFFGPAATGLVPQTVQPQHLQQANALMGMSENAASIAGPALGGILVVAASPGWGLAFDGAAFLASAASLALLRLSPPELAVRKGTLAELRAGWHAFTSRAWLWTSVASLTLIVTVVFAPLAVLGPEVARRDLGGAAAWAAINTATGIGAVIGGAIGLRWHPRHPLRSGFLLTLAGEPAVLALVAGDATVAPIILFALIAGLAASLFNVFWFTTLQHEITAQEISRVSSWDHLGTYALEPIGLATVGPIAIALGLSTTLYAAAGLVVLLTAAVLAMPAVRNFTLTSANPAAANDRQSDL